MLRYDHMAQSARSRAGRSDLSRFGGWYSDLSAAGQEFWDRGVGGRVCRAGGRQSEWRCHKVRSTG